jgi:EAL domain-containing protein (putative c-di-GMP-specific phosphodiesterase class I)
VPAFLKQTAARYDIPSNLLDVEITESALTDTMHILQQNMAELREGKFSLWLDDFGSGYSSLNVLKDFRFNVLKIDMVFLRGYPENKRTEPLLTSIVRLAKDLNMITLCEGVETEEQYEFLRSIGCDRAQGYYFGKPAPRE